MMLYPSIMDLMKKAESRYSLVIAASKRAREICEETQAQGNGLDGAKSITQAVSEISAGDIEIVEGRSVEPDKRAILENTISDKMTEASEEAENNEDEE